MSLTRGHSRNNGLPIFADNRLVRFGKGIESNDKGGKKLKVSNRNPSFVEIPEGHYRSILAHEATSFERFSMDAHVVNHSEDESFLCPDARPLALQQRGDFELNTGLNKIRRTCRISGMDTVVMPLNHFANQASRGTRHRTSKVLSGHGRNSYLFAESAPHQTSPMRSNAVDVR